jgi:hypothetical protein
MMAYDKQLKDFATMYDGGYSLGRYEDLDPHGCIYKIWIQSAFSDIK